MIKAALVTKIKNFTNDGANMAAGPDEAGFIKTILEYAWAGIGALVAIIWKKHNEEIADIKGRITKVDERMSAHANHFDGRIDGVERNSVPLTVYEQNRKEVRDVQIKVFDRLDQIGQSLARIEGKLDK